MMTLFFSRHFSSLEKKCGLAEYGQILTVTSHIMCLLNFKQNQNLSLTLTHVFYWLVLALFCLCVSY